MQLVRVKGPRFYVLLNRRYYSGLAQQKIATVAV